MNFPDLWMRWKQRYRLPDDETREMKMTVGDFRNALQAAHETGVNHARQNAAQDDSFMRDFFRGFGGEKL
jgi:hypothetical protein